MKKKNFCLNKCKAYRKGGFAKIAGRLLTMYFDHYIIKQLFFNFLCSICDLL